MSQSAGSAKSLSGSSTSEVQKNWVRPPSIPELTSMKNTTDNYHGSAHPQKTGTCLPPGSLTIKGSNSELAELTKLGLDRIEIRQLTGIVIALGILNDTVLIDDESGALRHTAHVEILFG